ncbi:MAG: tRNA (N6-isopentenyl adenosine(37)-C2)-methylthiotransferase MiaB [bacterium]|nr:tRNA (N6-isopentenyl adenosine(37)-C2)-methylthiotransferase MiaB [bacterium]
MEILQTPLKKFYIKTYGCQMNFSESEIISGLLLREGFKPAEDIQEADIIILNTCTVRDTAANKIIGKLGELKKLKELNPGLILGIGGCFAQAESEFLCRKAPFLDFIFGTQNKLIIPDLIKMVESSRISDDYETVLDISVQDESQFEYTDVSYSNPVSAWLPIMQGCDNFCSYCIVPYVRGKEISRLPGDIIQQVSGLAERGYKEIILLGQNVNSYGKRFSVKTDLQVTFTELLKNISNIEGIERIRFITSHPKDLSDDLIDLMSTEKKICKSLHLPVQSGSDRILKLMKRQYTREYYLGLISKLKTKIPEISFSTDIIVGFPGETEDDFNDTVELVKEVRYEQGYLFRFSVRTGTAAEKLPDHLSEEVKKDRLWRLMEIQDRITEEESRKYSGKTIPVLVEGADFKKEGEHLTGRTETNKIVIFNGSEKLIGNIVKVKINRTTPYTLFGEVI